MTQEQDRYISPFSTRYASDEMQGLFSARHRAELWRRLWIILAESEMELGLPVTKAQVEELKAHATDIDFERQAQYEKELRHDVMSHIRTYADQCPLAAPIIHLGATSCYVGDNSDILIIRDALLLVRARLIEALRALYAFAERYADLPTLAYTHFQPAQPTTVGKRATLWMNDLVLDIEACEQLLSTLRPLGCKGTTGTQASFLELFDGDYEKVKALDQRICRKMGFTGGVPVSGQTYSRKTDAQVLSLLAQIGVSAHKFAADVRLLAHEKELEEPFEKQQVGSSAMAYKRNPMRCERMTALSRYLIANVQNGYMTAAEQWLERTLDDSANRRVSLSEGFLCADAVLALYLNVASGLVVNERVIERNLRDELPFMATENLLMDAVRAGGDRQKLHEKIRRYSLEASRRIKQEGQPGDLLEALAADPDFPLTQERIDSLLRPELYIGCAGAQTRDFLRETVAPLLAKYQDLQVKEKTIEV
ncbi:MAG: adenylosuccinate lyase [Clostridia bacterium]|nr:adenylosuccinate lyase [Clostridia bacterium]